MNQSYDSDRSSKVNVKAIMESGSPTHPPYTESNAPNQEPKSTKPESNAPNPLTIDSTQSQSVRFFYNNVDSVNRRENGLLIENENLFHKINILETEIQDL